MPLTWDITRVIDFSEINSGTESVKTQGLVFATMVIGMNEITDTNAGEFYTRIKMLEGANGALVYTSDIAGSDYFYTPADIQRRIGLHTNANRYTKTKFVNHLYQLGIDTYTRRTKVSVNA